MRCRGYMAWVRPADLVLALAGPAQESSRDPLSPEREPVAASLDVLDVRFVGAAPRSNEPRDPLTGSSNYLIGNDETKWVRNAPAYGRVRYDDMWPGVGMTYLDGGRGLRVDFDVAPGADPSAIAIRVDGASGVCVGDDGALRVESARGTVVLSAPVAFEGDLAARRAVGARWTVADDGRIGIDVTDHDPRLPLTIDPSITYATFFGGAGNENAGGIALDASGNIYVAGYTTSADLPVTTGAFQQSRQSSPDSFCTMFNPSGSALVYSTYFGGTGFDQNSCVAVDGSGNAYLHGMTNSTNFPVTAGAVETTLTASGHNPSYVLKLNSTGTSLSYSTYVNAGYGSAIAVNAAGEAFIAVPRTIQSLQPVIYKLNASGTAYVYASAQATAGDSPTALFVDSSDDVYVAGVTASTSFPTTGGAFQTTYGGGNSDSWIMKLGPTGAVVYATLLGGSGIDIAFGISADSAGNA